MQISASTQNTYIATPLVELKTTPTVAPSDTCVPETDTINKSAYNYFDLGEDISSYVKTDPVQEKTNQELVTYLSGIMNNTTPEGKKNLHAFDTGTYGVTFANMTKEEAKELEANLMAQTYEDAAPNPFPADRRYGVYGVHGEHIAGMSMEEMKDFLGKDYAKNSVYDLETLIKKTGIFIVDFNERQKQFSHETKEIPPMKFSMIMDGYHRITQEESDKLRLERFKNLYSFSDEFSKTDKFKELFDKYQVQANKQAEEIADSSKPFFDRVDPKAYITAEIAKQGFSKSEAINYYATVSNDLKDILSSRNLSDNTYIVKDMKESIKLYDKITADLKDMWGYGDLDVRA